MIKVQYSDFFKKKIRKDEPISELGTNTYSKIRNAIEKGNKQEALELLEYLWIEGKILHDLYCDWTYADLTYIADKFGEEEVPRMLGYVREVFIKVGQAPTSMSTVIGLSTEELVAYYAESMRAHRTGPGEKGDFILREEKDRYVMEFDPCGSGGRMRREGEIDKTPPRTGPPINLGKTKKPHNWSWNKVGVPYYCIHCCLWHEVLLIEERGYPTKITEWPNNPNEKCKWYFYKDPELIPEEYFTRVGFRKDTSKFKKKS